VKTSEFREKIIYFIIPLTVVVLTGLYVIFFYIDLFKLGTHFGIKELEFKDNCITGRAENVGRYNVDEVYIRAFLKRKDDGLEEVIIPLNPEDLEVGEESEFSYKIDDPQDYYTDFFRATINTRS
jgi:BioD-like phosphotransacetylase family protein